MLPPQASLKEIGTWPAAEWQPKVISLYTFRYAYNHMQPHTHTCACVCVKRNHAKPIKLLAINSSISSLLKRPIDQTVLICFNKSINFSILTYFLYLLFLNLLLLVQSVTLAMARGRRRWSCTRNGRGRSCSRGIRSGHSVQYETSTVLIRAHIWALSNVNASQCARNIAPEIPEASRQRGKRRRSGS